MAGIELHGESSVDPEFGDEGLEDMTQRLADGAPSETRQAADGGDEERDTTARDELSSPKESTTPHEQPARSCSPPPPPAATSPSPTTSPPPKSVSSPASPAVENTAISPSLAAQESSSPAITSPPPDRSSAVQEEKVTSPSYPTVQDSAESPPPVVQDSEKRPDEAEVEEIIEEVVSPPSYSTAPRSITPLSAVEEGEEEGDGTAPVSDDDLAVPSDDDDLKDSLEDDDDKEEEEEEEEEQEQEQKEEKEEEDNVDAYHTEISSPADSAVRQTETQSPAGVVKTPSPLPSPPPDTEETDFKMADTEVQQQQQQQQLQQQQQVQQEPKQQPQQQQEAVSKYRWAKILPTTSQRIIFFSSAHPRDPVFLHWSEESGAYYSEEKHVPCGDFTGHVIVEGKTYPVEPFNVRTYTFEIDLFIKDDVIEDEVATSNSLAEELKFQEQQQYQKGSVDTYQDISTSALTAYPKMEENGVADENGIRHNTKYEDLLRQQLQHKDTLDASLENEVALSQKSEHSVNGSGSKRLTPVGDVDKETFQDGYSSLPVGTSAGFDVDNVGRISRRSGSASDLDRCSSKSEMGSSRSSLIDVPLPEMSTFPKSPKSPSRASSEHGSGRRTPQRELFGDDAVSDVRQSPVRSAEGSARQSPYTGRPGSRSSDRRTPVDTRIEDVLGSTGTPVRQTPTRETIGDVLGSDAIVSSPGRSNTSGSGRQSRGEPDVWDRDAVSTHSSTRSTPQKETISAALRGSQERLYGSQDLPAPAGERSQSASASGSRHSSRAQSLSSLTSEAELSLFLDPNAAKNGSSDLERTPVNFDTHPDESTMLPPIMRDRDRPASLPAYSTQSPSGVDKRSYTPDHRNWGQQGSAGTGELGVPRDLPPRSLSSSRASSRTVTPVNVGAQDTQKVRELEETVATLRKLLGSREQEVHELTAQIRDLKEINQSLKRDLEHARARRTPSGPEELERQYQQLLKEKEILAAEVVKLRDRLEAKGSKVDTFSTGAAATRRIDELEAHIRDLRDTCDSTGQKLTRSELRIKELLDENDKLRSASSLRVQDLQDDRGGRHSDRQYLIEIQQLKEDVRTLRERNYALQDENLKLKEGREPHRSPDARRDFYSERPRLTSSIRSDDGVVQRTAGESSSHRDINPRSADHISQSRTQALVSPRNSSARRALDRSYGSDSFPVPSSRDPPTRYSTESEPREGGAPTYSRSRLEHAKVDKERSPAGERLRYRDFGSERGGGDFRKTDPGRYDLLRSRPDGEVSEKLTVTDGARYSTLSSERLKSFDRERERGGGDTTKISMSAERLRILEEAERDRERRAMIGSSSAGSRAYPSESYQYQPFRERFLGRFTTSPERQTLYSYTGDYSFSGAELRAHSDTQFPSDTGRQRRGENNSDDSDSTAVLMAYDVKADTLPKSRERERERSSYSERGKWQSSYTDPVYMKETHRDLDKDRDFRDLRRSYKETNGDDSDTATDILLNAEPATTTKSSRRRHRHNSGSDASLSSLSDPDDPPESLRRRSRSADTKGKRGNPSRYGQSTSLRPAASAERLSGGKMGMMSTAGFRSVTPQPLTTQHNRGLVIQQMQSQQATLASSLTQGLRPFAPRSAADIRPDDVVKFSRQGGKLSQGTVKFVGHLPGRTDVYLGVELYKEEGKHDGTFEGIRYFKCKPNKGVFVAFNKVVMAWAPN